MIENESTPPKFPLTVNISLFLRNCTAVMMVRWYLDTRGAVSKILVSRRSRYVAMTMTVDVSKYGKFTNLCCDEFV